MGACYGLTQFEFDEELDLKNYRLWLQDGVHGFPAWTPLHTWAWCVGLTDGFQYAHETLSFPGSKGWDLRAVNGYVYFAIIEPKPEEVPEREKLFRERIAPMIEDPWGEWAKAIDEVLALYKHIKEVDIEKVSDVELEQLFHETLYVNRRWWEIHFIWDSGTCSIYQLFEVLCEELTGTKPEDVLFSKLMSGFDNILFRAERDTWLLADRARELGLADLFLTIEDDEQVMSKLGETDAGRKWLEQLRAYVKAHGWKCSRTWDWASPSWIEKPSLAIPEIRTILTRGGVFTLDEKRKRLTREREEAEKEIMTKVPVAQREWFEKLLHGAQFRGSITEEHNYYFDMMGMAVCRKVIVEIGRRFAEAGVIDDRDDIFMLMPWEIRKALIPMERINLRPYVKPRREEYEGYLKMAPTPFFGDINALGDLGRKDPNLGTVAGAPRVRPELKADLYGAASAPGVVEGIARLAYTIDDLKEVKEGEILVSPATSAAWTYVFNIISGVVTDMGGALFHAVIVGREFGIPAVSGTMEATKKIKTGDRIRVDGDMATVYILERAA